MTMVATGPCSETNGSTLERTALAYERTYTAWIRTGLAAFGGGLGARALLGHDLPDWLVRVTSSTLLMTSLLMFAASATCVPLE
jgi:uncharacterized membrane protein YidH (DUF202 family)